MKIKNHTLKAWVGLYGTVYLDPEGEEVPRPYPMTLEQANFLRKQFGKYGTYVVEL